MDAHTALIYGANKNADATDRARAFIPQAAVAAIERIEGRSINAVILDDVRRRFGFVEDAPNATDAMKFNNASKREKCYYQERRLKTPARIAKYEKSDVDLAVRLVCFIPGSVPHNLSDAQWVYLISNYYRKGDIGVDKAAERLIVEATILGAEGLIPASTAA